MKETDSSPISVLFDFYQYVYILLCIHDCIMDYGLRWYAFILFKDKESTWFFNKIGYKN